MKLWIFLVIYVIAKTIHRMPGGNYVPLSQEIPPPPENHFRDGMQHNQWWLSAIQIFTKFRKLKTEFCRSFRISLFRISRLMLWNVLPQREKTYLFRKKYPSIHWTFSSHARCFNMPTFFTLSSFSWKVEIANFPSFSRLPLRQQNPGKRYVFWNWTI